MNNRKQYFNSRFKKIIGYLICFFIGLLMISAIIGPPKHYLVPTLSVVFVRLILEWWKYRDWKKDNHL